MVITGVPLHWHSALNQLELLLLTINEASGQLAHVVEVDTDKLALDKSQDEYNSTCLE